MDDILLECLRIAVRNNVTDIHFEIGKTNDLKIEMRVRGEIRTLKQKIGNIQFFRYLMYRANLDLSSRSDPQTGRFDEVVDGMPLSLRFSLINSRNRTSGVLRILNQHTRLSVDMLSTCPDDIEWLEGIARQRIGLYILSGPTGSGKTTTLYTLLSEIRNRKIFTLEDPVERDFDQFVQIQINEKQGFGYADGIKQLMRHDPDIIMIGEIRDSTAAEMAVRCALTGHLVVTSLHAGSCPSAIHRMLELGVREYQLSDVLYGLSNQRLFDTVKGGKTGVYEIMDRTEIESYFTVRKPTERFVPLREKIRRAAASGQIKENLSF